MLSAVVGEGDAEVRAACACGDLGTSLNLSEPWIPPTLQGGCSQEDLHVGGAVSLRELTLRCV